MHPTSLYIVWDDVGFGALDCFGGLIEAPNMSRLAAMGLRYTQFHTTALCSPTRACLLTGRNATSNGMACISEFASGYPAANGRIPFENAMIAQVLQDRGYSTYALGKWHLTPDYDNHAAGSRTQWPLGRGFGDRFVYYPDCAPVPQGVAANPAQRSFDIAADLNIHDGHPEGVIFAQGSDIGGHTLYVRTGGSTTFTTGWARCNKRSRPASRCPPASTP